MITNEEDAPWYQHSWVWVVLGLPLVVIIISGSIAVYMIKNPLPEVQHSVENKEN